MMKNWRVELTTGRKNLSEVKIQRKIFPGDVLSPLLFVIAMMPLSHILRKYTGGYKLYKFQQINHLMYMDDIKLLVKNEKELETLIQAGRIYWEDVGMEFGLEKCAMLVLKSGKQQMMEGIYKYLGILEVDTIKHGGKCSKPSGIAEISSKG